MQQQAYTIQQSYRQIVATADTLCLHGLLVWPGKRPVRFNDHKSTRMIESFTTRLQPESYPDMH